MTKREIIEDSLLALTVVSLFSFIFSFTHAFQSDHQNTEIPASQSEVVTPVVSSVREQRLTFVSSDALERSNKATTSTATIINADVTLPSDEPSLIKNEALPTVEIPILTQGKPEIIESVPVGIPSSPNLVEEEFALEISALITEQTNAFRKSNNLHSLYNETSLQKYAKLHSVSMLENDFFAHADQNGCDITCRLKANGYRASSWGENLAQMEFSKTPTAKEVVSFFMKGWEKSVGHRKNLLSPLFTHQGIGIAVSDNAIYVTVDFAKP